MDSYPKAAMERAMKVQDVMLQAMAKKITWRQGEEILGISDRHMRPWRERYVEGATTGCGPAAPSRKGHRILRMIPFGQSMLRHIAGPILFRRDP